MAQIFLKDPQAVLDYVFDWAAETNGQDDAVADWLASGETITDHTVTATTGLTVDSSAIVDATADASQVRVWVSGGTDRQRYDVTCHITTNAGRQDDRTIHIRVRQR